MLLSVARRGEVINGGFGLLLDGSEEAATRARLMLNWDVSNGVRERTAAASLVASLLWVTGGVFACCRWLVVAGQETPTPATPSSAPWRRTSSCASPCPSPCRTSNCWTGPCGASVRGGKASAAIASRKAILPVTRTSCTVFSVVLCWIKATGLILSSGAGCFCSSVLAGAGGTRASLRAMAPLRKLRMVNEFETLRADVRERTLQEESGYRDGDQQPEMPGLLAVISSSTICVLLCVYVWIEAVVRTSLSQYMRRFHTSALLWRLGAFIHRNPNFHVLQSWSSAELRNSAGHAVSGRTRMTADIFCSRHWWHLSTQNASEPGGAVGKPN